MWKRCDAGTLGAFAVHSVLGLAILLTVSAVVLQLTADKPYKRCRGTFGDNLEACEAHPRCFVVHNAYTRHCSGPTSTREKFAAGFLWTALVLAILWCGLMMVGCAMATENGLSGPNV